MLTGQRPWEGVNLYGVISKQKRVELQPLAELRPDAPSRLVYLVEGAMRKNPAERWNSAAEFVEQASTIAPEEGWARWQSERQKRRRAMVYSAARERGDSVLSAALETVRFRRDLGKGRPDGPPGVVPAAVAALAEAPNAPAARRPSSPATERPKRSWASAVIVTAIALAAVAASARVIRGRAEPAVAPQTQATFADNGGVE